MSTQPPWDINAPPTVAYIREDECIGCTKCIPDCPTDAIMGAAKLMHTVITDVCTGCGACVPACPVDCIDMRPLAQRSSEQKIELNTQWLKRFDAHNQRTLEDKKKLQEEYDKIILKDAADPVAARQQYINEIIERSKK